MRQVNIGVVAASLFALALGSVTAAAQATPSDQKIAASDGQNTTAAAAAAQAPDVPKASAATADSFKANVQRWFDVQTATLQIRYRRVESSAGVVTSDHVQDWIGLRMRAKFDRKGRYTLNAGFLTGSSFIGSWNNTGWGTGGPAANPFDLRQLFVAAAPVKGLDASYGGLAIVRGESTEITSYDNDGYVVGSRVSVKRPKDLYLDDVSVTIGYLGETTKPSVLDRFSHLDEVNYQHYLVAKKVGKTIGLSTDYTRLSGVGTMRAAFNLKTPDARVVDFVRYEQYRRLDGTPAWGFSTYGEKALTKRLSAGGGYADIDAKYGGLNADRFNRGRRFFEQANVKVFRDLTVALFTTQAVWNSFTVSNKYRTDVVVSYNALGPMQRAGYFR